MLTISYLANGNILLNSPQIQALMANPSAYTKLKIDATINCCPELFSHTTLNPFIDPTYLLFTTAGIEVLPLYFNIIGVGQTVMDGIYKFNVKIFVNDNQYTFEENCAFIDVTYRCKVATYIDNILDTTSEDGTVATNVHVLHYALVNASDCGCNCQALCDTFRQLAAIVNPIIPTMQSCGC